MYLCIEFIYYILIFFHTWPQVVSNSQTSLLDSIFICGGRSDYITGINPTLGRFLTLKFINMVPLIFAAVLAVFVGIFCLVSYKETGNETSLIIATINFALALTDFVVLLFNL